MDPDGGHRCPTRVIPYPLPGHPTTTGYPPPLSMHPSWLLSTAPSRFTRLLFVSTHRPYTTFIINRVINGVINRVINGVINTGFRDS